MTAFEEVEPARSAASRTRSRVEEIVDDDVEPEAPTCRKRNTKRRRTTKARKRAT